MQCGRPGDRGSRFTPSGSPGIGEGHGLSQFSEDQAGGDFVPALRTAARDGGAAGAGRRKAGRPLGAPGEAWAGAVESGS